MAFHVRARDARAALSALWQREMLNKVYLPRFLPLTLRPARTSAAIGEGRSVRALAFVADRGHAQYTCDLDTAETARLVAQGHGARGPNIDYVANTLQHMETLGVRDLHLQRVLELARTLKRK